jgi:hypothetical protein
MNTLGSVKASLSALRAILGSAALWVLVSAVAGATTLTDTLIFTGATDFTPTGAPTDPVSGSITFTFDPALAVVTKPVDAISLTIDGVSFSPSDTFFSVSPTDCAPIQCAPGGDRITINGLQSRVGFNYDFDTNSAQQVALVFNFSYDVPSRAGLVTYKPLTGPGSIVCVDSVCPAAASAPEPATLGLFCLGLVSLGLSLHRRAFHSDLRRRIQSGVPGYSFPQRREFRQSYLRPREVLSDW